MKQHGRIAAMIFMAVNVILIILCIIFFVRMDRVAPDFRFSMNDLIYEDGMNESRLLEGITATDNRDGDVTDSIVIEKIIKKDGGNSVVVFYAVSDRSGNVTKTSRMFPCMSEESENIDSTENAAAAGTEDLQGSDADAAAEAEAEDMQADDTAAEKTETEGDETEETETEESERGEAVEAEDSETEGAETGDDGAAESEAENSEADDRAERDNDAAENQSEEKTQAENRTAEQQVRAEEERTNAGTPVLTLKTNEVTVEAGTPPAWVNVIQSLSDDKDSYETLFHNLNISEYDIHKAGTYQVTVTTTDSDKQVSQPVSLTIHVK